MQNGQDSQELLTIGKIIKSQGIQGEVKVLPLTDFPERFDLLSQVKVVLSDSRILSLAIEKVRYDKSFVYLKFKNYTSRDQVESLREGLLQIERSEAVELPEGSYLHFDIIGLSVYTEEGQEVGIITDILSTGSNDVYLVKSSEDQEYLIPATTEVIKEIDLAKKILVIYPVEGFLLF